MEPGRRFGIPGDHGLNTPGRKQARATPRRRPESPAQGDSPLHTHTHTACADDEARPAETARTPHPNRARQRRRLHRSGAVQGHAQARRLAAQGLRVLGADRRPAAAPWREQRRGAPPREGVRREGPAPSSDAVPRGRATQRGDGRRAEGPRRGGLQLRSLRLRPPRQPSLDAVRLALRRAARALPRLRAPTPPPDPDTAPHGLWRHGGLRQPPRWLRRLNGLQRTWARPHALRRPPPAEATTKAVSAATLGRAPATWGSATPWAAPATVSGASFGCGDLKGCGNHTGSGDFVGDNPMRAIRVRASCRACGRTPCQAMLPRARPPPMGAKARLMCTTIEGRACTTVRNLNEPCLCHNTPSTCYNLPMSMLGR